MLWLQETSVFAVRPVLCTQRESLRLGLR